MVKQSIINGCCANIESEFKEVLFFFFERIFLGFKEGNEGRNQGKTKVYIAFQIKRKESRRRNL